MVTVQPLSDGDPRRLGDYDVAGRLGEGGQGVVYLGRGHAGSVAIKLLHAQLIEDEPARARFVREVEVTKRVARFCTAQVLSAGLAGGRPYIVSEYVPGPSLHQQLRAEGPRRGSALDRLAINTATALAAIHQAGVVHRDFKPGNVLMGPDGPVVIDFGISRALDASGSMTSAVSQVVGTPAFMAPEQLAEGLIGPHTDMFAWAVTMVYAASGVPAFGHRSIPQVINRILHEEPDLGALDGRLRPIVAACLSKDPAKRLTARSLMDELMGHNVPAASFSGGSGTTPGLTPDRPAGEGLSAGASAGAAAVRPVEGTAPSSAGGPPFAGGSAGRGDAEAATAYLSGGGSPSFGGRDDSEAGAAYRSGDGRSSFAGDAEAGTAYVSGGDPSSFAGSGGRRDAEAGAAFLPGGGSSFAGGRGDAEAGTAYLPLDGSPSFAGGPGRPGSPEHGTVHLPASGPSHSGGGPGMPGSPMGPGPAGPPERKSRTVLIVGAVVAAAVVLIAGIAALASSGGGSSDDQAAAPSPPAQHARRPAKHRTPSEARTPTRLPAAVKSVRPRANPYTPQSLCGAGYGVVGAHPVGEARTYLLYNAHAGTNCVVTLLPKSTGKVFMGASLIVQGGRHGSRDGTLPFYAGPVRLPAKGKCVIWGGAWKTAKWSSGWSHCGK